MKVGTKTGDGELLRAYARDGSETAFAELVRRHQIMMRAAAYRVSGDSEEALDAMQRALIAFARRAKEIRAEAGAGPWLHRAVTLEAMSLRRQRMKRKAREHEAMEMQQQTGESMPQEIAAELDGAIDRLMPKDRDVIVMHYLEGHTFRSIAGRLGGTEVAWQKRGVRALSKVAAALKRRGVVATTTGLGTWMAAARAEAGLSPTKLDSMLGKAFQSPLSASAPLKGAPFFYLIMKTKIALTTCFIGSAVLSYTWSEQATGSLPMDQARPTSMTIQTRSERSQREAPEFDLGGIAAAVQHLDSLEADDPSAESQLRALMFSVPEDHLGEVREILNGVKNTGRFQNVAAAFYARWAEIDPEAAYLAAAEAGAFSASARRGVLMTWLNIEPEVALARLLEDRKPADLGTLSEFIDIKAQHAPRDAAELVDHLAEKWPEADKRLFPKVATTWALIDPVAAGEWVESYWDRGVRNRLLRSLSQKIASGRGSPGMALADRIDDPEARSEARMNAARWWGISQGGFVFSEKSNPEIQLIDGFPDDWTENEIRSLALGMMANASKSYPDLIGIAKDEKQSQAIYEGVINGASFSQPALVVDAVAGVDPQFAATPAGKKALTSFILRWNENDAGGAKTWLASQPPNPKTQLMRKALTEKANP